MKKVYVDTCVLSSLINLDMPDPEVDALDKISENENIILVTSDKTLAEFINTKEDKKRVAFKVLFKIISKIPSENVITTHPPLWGSIPWGVAQWGEGYDEEKPLFIKLKQIFKNDDAEHIFQAINAKCDYFLTLDIRTILNKAQKNKSELLVLAPQMLFVKPSDLLKDMNLVH